MRYGLLHVATNSCHMEYSIQSLWSFYSYVTFVGKSYDKIWGGECAHVENFSGNIEDCKIACKKKSDCTVFNYSAKYKGCALRACSIPAPVPTWSLEDFVGYTMG